MGETRELAKFVSGLKYEDIPQEVVAKAKTTMADSLAGGPVRRQAGDDSVDRRQQDVRAHGCALQRHDDAHRGL